jgi:threonine dehydratase
MPENAPALKKEATVALGAEIVEVGPASTERKQRAEELAAEFCYTIVPPYDHPAIIAGQGTCGLEIVEQLPGVDLILSPVSGGGLLSGIATAVKLAAPHVKVWGAEPELAADARESFYTKKLVEWPASRTTRTIGDGLRTQSLGHLNFDHVLRYVDGIAAVSEEEILAAMRVMLHTTTLVPEPSGAVTLAAALFHAKELGDEAGRSRKVVVVLSGGNLDPALKKELQQEPVGNHVA